MASIAVRQTLQDAWTRRGWLAWLLWPSSLAYGLVWQLRQQMYRRGLLAVHRVGVPVIVVGNVVAGGAGKTPLVIALVQHLQVLGLRPGVVSRGYGRSARDCRLVSVDALAEDVGDEPLLIHRRTQAPVGVAGLRVEAALALLAAHPELDLLVCDDGLQHHALHRDIDICLFDDRGIGNGFLLPAGPLREPWPRPTDLVVWSSKQTPGQAVHRVRRELADHAVRADGSQVALHALAAAKTQESRPIFAVAGTAQPQAFFQMLRARGLTLASTQPLPDHASFEAAHWDRADDHILLCTEKDAVKLWRHRPDALAVPLVVNMDRPFWAALEQLLHQRGTEPIRTKLSSAHGHSPA